ncbi:MAG TPA: hypothetical protein VFI57_01025 [Pyrinomonadaceae bacterium]|nr:hypothetical protein [Pyrinomonadaceae bacterium]
MMLERFLATGNLGDVHIGLSKSEVRRILGEPQDYSPRRKKHEIWKYGSLQIAFTEDVVNFLGLYFDEGVLVLPEQLIGEARVVIENTSLQAVEELLIGKGLHFAVDEELTFDDQRRLLIEESGASIMFSDAHLVSIQLGQT